MSAHLEYLEDKDNRYTPADVLHGPESLQFKKNKMGILNFGFTGSRYWIRTALFLDPRDHAAGEDWLLIVEYSLLNRIRLYLPDGKGGYTVMTQGNTLPFGRRPIEYRFFTFPLTLTAGRENKILLEFSSQSSMQMPITLIRPVAFGQRVQLEYIANGLFYGITFVMIFYNLFLFFSVRDRSYILYVCYVLFFTLWQASLDGFGYQYLWPGSTFLASKFVPLFPILVSIWAYLFTRNFLNTPKYLPKFDWILKIFLALLIVEAVVSIFLPYRIAIQIAAVVAVIGSFFLLVAGYISMINRYRPAIFYSTAWTLFLLGNIILSLSKFGLLPRIFVTEHASQLGSILEVVLLSLALGDRIAIERREKMLIKEELMVAQNIQKSILPDVVPKSRHYEIAALYVPMESVGGDFYDFHIINDDKVGVLVTDVSGHGIPAALIASMVKIAFDMHRDLAEEPAALLSGLNDILTGNLEKQFLTAGYVFIDFGCRRLSYVRGGHVPLLVFKRARGEIIECIPRGILLGIIQDAEYRCETLPIETGDRIILYTDGITEAFNDRGQMYSEKKLFELVSSTRDLPPKKVIESLLASISRWTGKKDSFDDDLTIIVIDVR